MLLQTCNELKKNFSAFRRLAMSRKKIFHRFADLQWAEKKFFTVLQTCNEPKKNFSSFCRLATSQIKIFHKTFMI